MTAPAQTPAAHLPPGRSDRPIPGPLPARQSRCPVPGCLVGHSPGHVACRRHWLKVPIGARRTLADVFRRRETDPDAYQTARLVAAELILRAARDEEVRWPEVTR